MALFDSLNFNSDVRHTPTSREIVATLSDREPASYDHRLQLTKEDEKKESSIYAQVLITF